MNKTLVDGVNSLSDIASNSATVGQNNDRQMTDLKNGRQSTQM